MRLETQQSIINKALKDNKIPFTRNQELFQWTGTTKVKSKASGMSYDVEVGLSIKTNPRMAEQISACLLKVEGIRMEDLMIAGMIDPKLDGLIELKGLPKETFERSVGKFIKKMNKPPEEN
jgi:hypothetical protein